MTQSLKLYGFLLCPFTQRVRFTLEALNIKYEYIDIDLLTNKQSDESYLKINPLGQVPSIEFNNNIIYDSLVILQFLDDQFGGAFPKDSIQKAKMRIWVNYFNDNVLKYMKDAFIYTKAKDVDGMKKIAKSIGEQISYFTKNSQLSERIRANPTGFYDGNQLTYADFAIVPHIKNLECIYRLFFNEQLFELIENYDLIKDFRTYLSNVSSTDAFQRVTTKPLSLPPHGSNFIIDSLNYTVDTYNYEKVFETFLKKKYDS